MVEHLQQYPARYIVRVGAEELEPEDFILDDQGCEIQVDVPVIDPDEYE